ncbi:DUF6531 domain-containing protein [Microvirga sp. M2]|uniref:DUF6531 domain-containing protein n=1 Tax=Microvirga sp. M2 TaxID=3073270 RepID=UPI0039C16D7F
MPRSLLRLLPALPLLIGLGLAAASAQTQGEGVLGWRVVPPDLIPEYYATPIAACRRQHEIYNPDATFYGYKDSPQTWATKTCDWCLLNVGAQACWFVRPGPTDFICASGYSRVYPGSCVKAADPREEVQACEGSGGSVNPVTPHPIAILTGAKLLSATDFAAPDGDLRLERTYRSRGGSAFVDTPPLGLGLGWRLAFQHELAIDPSFSASQRVTLKTADGASYDFQRQSDGSLAPVYAGARNGARNADYRLAFEGPWPADLSQVRRMKTRWRFIDPDGATWILESFDQPGLNAFFEVARPVSLARRDGYGQSFAYGPLSELAGLTDSFGRQIAFTWHYATTGGPTTITYPAALASATVPGGSRIAYAYEPLSPADGPARPERLARVTQTAADGTLLEQTAYLHEDARFASQVTGIVDARGVRTLTVAYDGRGRAVTSELADGAERVSVDYGEATTPLTTDLSYDDAGRLVDLGQTDTTSHSLPYPTAGRRRVWTYAYGIGNRLTAVDGPLYDANYDGRLMTTEMAG